MQLNSALEKEFRLTDSHKKALKRLGLETLSDLLFYFPTRYGTAVQVKNIENIFEGEDVAIYGKIQKLKAQKTFKTKVAIASATLTDETGNIDLIWFNQPYIAKTFKENSVVKIQGKVGKYKDKLTISNPEIEKVDKVPTGVGNSLFSNEETALSHPIYRETRGLTSNWIHHKIVKILSSDILKDIKDPIPEYIIEKYKLPTLKTALIWIHTPQKEEHALSARKRFAFQEIFLIQIEKQKEKRLYEASPSFRVETDKQEIQKFIDRFPFKATNAQLTSIEKIVEDFKSENAMSRLLEGDVGSGKTAVAAASVYSIATTRPNGQSYGRLQTAYMAPTEILAEQHFESFIEYFSYLNINIGLITSSGCKKFPSKLNPTKATDISRAQLLKWVEGGEIPILIGTHSLIQKKVKFQNLAYVIIDEQHRFGTKQRMSLRNKEDKIVPHLLSMTATPIPRTLALTIYGDLDITLLDEMPQGRKQVITEIVLPKDRKKIYDQIKDRLKEGRQVYVICPRIDVADPDKQNSLRVKSVKEEATRLKKEVFPDYEIDVMHGKLKSKEKEEVMQKFKDKKTDILVATSVIEVGVNVPNSTVIIIEGAERFGLAQLHQLRGRVMRSSHQSYCYVFSDSESKQTFERLQAFQSAKNGFELAEKDLLQRGFGDLAGKKQWGMSDLAMESLKNIKMVEASREEAKKIISEDFELENFPETKEHLENKNSKIHFE